MEKPESTGRQSIIHGVNWETTQTIYPVFKVELSQLTNSTTTSICKPNYSTLPEDIRTMNFTLPMKAELSSAIPTHVEPTIWIFPY